MSVGGLGWAHHPAVSQLGPRKSPSLYIYIYCGLIWPGGGAARDIDPSADRSGLYMVIGPVLTAPVSDVPALFATVRAGNGPFRPLKPPPAALEAVLTERNVPGRARTVSSRAGTSLTGAVRTG